MDTGPIANDSSPPPTGTRMSLPVFPSATRTTWFPETTTIFTPQHGIIELVMLRQEFVLAMQHGEVINSDERGAEIKVVGTEIIPQVQDIGHVRLKQEVAIDMAINLLTHVSRNKLMDSAELRRRCEEALAT